MKQLIAAMLLFAICISVSAQKSTDDAGKTLERCLIEVEHLRATCHTLAEVRTLEGRLKAANDLLAAYKSQIARLNSIIESASGLDAANISEHAERIRAFEARLRAEQNEAHRLRKENGNLRRSRNIFIGILIGTGVTLVWALTGK